MRRKTLLALLFLLLLPVPVSAQQVVRLNSLQIEIWPEFDRPEALVIYRGLLSPDIGQSPVEVSLRIPAEAGEPNAVAVRQGGSLINAPYEFQPGETWSTVRFTITEVEFQVEYYDPGLQKDGVTRQMTYTWPGDFAVEQMIVSLQEPVGAQNMQVLPPLGPPEQELNGLIFYAGELGAFEAGENFDLQFSYQKADDTLTADALPPQGAQGAQQAQGAGQPAAVAGTEGNQLLQWLAIILGVAVVAAGIYWLWSSGRLGKTEPAPARKRKRRVAAKTAPEGSDETVFCHSCGQNSVEGDRFCRNCGTELRL